MTRILASAALAFACAFTSVPASAAVNLNTATHDELLAVPGIGPTKAQAIVEHRKANGQFASVDDLKQVKGFRHKLVERLRPELTVAAAPAKVAAAPAKGASKGDAKGVPATQAASGRIVDDKPRK